MSARITTSAAPTFSETDLITELVTIRQSLRTQPERNAIDRVTEAFGIADAFAVAWESAEETGA